MTQPLPTFVHYPRNFISSRYKMQALSFLPALAALPGIEKVAEKNDAGKPTFWFLAFHRPKRRYEGC